MTGGQLLFEPTGRIGRKVYWIAMCSVVAAQIGVSLLLNWAPGLRIIVAIAFVYPRICLGAKRLHDFNKTGWLQIAPLLAGGLVQVVGMSLPRMGGAEDPRGLALKVALIQGLPMLLWATFYIWAGIPKGDPEKNRYGRPPRSAGAKASAAVFD